MNQQEYQDFYEGLDMEIFQDFEFGVQPEEKPEPSMVPSSYASAPLYVKSLGRGKKRTLNPLDIPLPVQYYEELEMRKKKGVPKSRKSAQQIIADSQSPAGQNADERTAKSPPRKERSPPPRKERSPPPRKERSPPPRKERSPPPRKERSPLPRKERSPLPRKERSPPPKDRSPPPPTTGRMRGRGRGRVLEEGLLAMREKKLPVVQVRDLGRAGLPNGSANVEEGKARLMQMFLGKESQFDLSSLYCSSDSSGHSCRTAPAYDIMNDKEFPQLITKGVPFKSGGSLDENLRRGRRKARILDPEGGASKPSSSNRVDRGTSDGDTAERSGERSSADEKLDLAGADSGMGVLGEGVPMNGTAASGEKNGSSGNGSSQLLEGPNVLELMHLPANLSKEDLGDLLMGCGNIIEMRILRDPDTQHCIGLAYVRMEDSDACTMAIDSYHDTESPFIEMYGDDEVPKLVVTLQGS